MIITSGEYEVIASGSVFNFNERPITIKLHDELSISLFFTDDDKQTESNVKFSLIDLNHARLDFINFANPLGAGYSKPIELGTIDGTEVYCTLWVSRVSVGSNTKRVEYTFYKKGVPSAS